MFDAIVIGGGVVGSAIAYHLVLAGAKTLLLDRQDSGRATDAGAGILAPESTGDEDETWFNLAVPAVAYYPSLLEQLEAAGAGETGYTRCGQLIVAVSEDELKPFEKTKQVVFARQKRRGTPSADDLYLVSSEEARRLFPALAPVYGAIYYHLGARVDGRLLAAALRQAGEQRGLVIRPASVERLRFEGQTVTGVIANGETIHAGQVAIAGGAWSQSFGSQLGVQIPVEPQRGQIIHLRLPGMDTTDWPIVNGFRGHYMLTWPNERVVVGATRETGAGFDPRTTVTGVREVLGEALRVAPGLAQAAIQDIRVGLRPRTPDNLPVLGLVPGIDGVYLATGHGATGLQLGPYTGKIIANLMLGREVEADLRPFAVTRFRSSPPAPLPTVGEG
jgi:D-amino-acid dehydrogenase